MAHCKLFFGLIIAVLILGHVGRCQSSWSKAMCLIFRSRYDIVAGMANTKNDGFQDTKVLGNLRRVLDNLPRIIDIFFSARFDTPVSEEDVYLKNLPQMLQELELPILATLFRSQSLGEKYDERIAEVVQAIKKRVLSFLSGQEDRYQLPLDDICPTSPSKYKTEKDVSITDICGSVNECSSNPHPYGSSFMETDVTTACTKDNKCDLEKALPMMAGVFWHLMNNFLFQGICFNQCLLHAGEECKYFKIYDRLKHEATLMKAYVSAVPKYFDHVWNVNFIQPAVEMRAFSDLDVALSMIQEKRNDFGITPTMCDNMQFSKACPYSDIYKEFVFIKKVQQHRTNPGLVKDLRMQSKVDHAKMVELQRSTLNHITLLGTIKKLDENLEASVSGISSYFKGLAKYDEGIADADVLFIQDELNNYEKATADLETKLKEDFTKGMALMEATALANLVEEAAVLAGRIAENCNPLRNIFGGTSPGDIFEQAGKAANAASKAVKATVLFVSLNNLAMDSAQINKAFFGEQADSNKNQIKTLKALVDKIRKNEAEDIGADADTFVKEYADYKPQRDRSKLVYNNELWSAYKDAMCDILNGDVGVAGSIPQSVAGGMLICEKLQGTLAQFFTLREDIFDFQFQLVDAVAKVVRGSIAKRLAKNIKDKGDVLPATELMLGFLMTQNRIQSHSSIYCDKLEYKQLGKPVEACSTVNGLFSQDNVDALIAYTDHSRYDNFERDVYIPTKARFQGDTGYLDLNSLGKGESVIFKLPAGEKWLQDYRWLLNGETTVPFVEKFKIFFPHTEYKTGAQQEHTTTRVTITSIAGSAVSTIAPNTSPVYILPRGHSSYVTVYEEGYSSCSSSEIDNPYSLCENLPKICDKSSRQAGESLLPTILSTWKLKFNILKGSNKLKWDAPKSETNLLIRAKVTLRMLPSKRKRSHLPKPSVKSNDVTSENGCCDSGNRYRNSLDDRICKECPENSTSKLRGLYCEINENQRKKKKKKKKSEI